MRHTVLRSATIAAVAIAALGSSGCHWFGKNTSVYQQSPESRPLEVPPDLDRPNTEGAVMQPAGASQPVLSSSVEAAAAASDTSGFTLTGDRDAVFAKVGEVLAATEGVTIASKAQALGAYDVSYQGANFLVRVAAVTAGVYVSAVDPRGMPATGAAPTQLIAALKAALGG
jgi:uncharacterized lipoprotein